MVLVEGDEVERWRRHAGGLLRVGDTAADLYIAVTPNQHGKWCSMEKLDGG